LPDSVSAFPAIARIPCSSVNLRATAALLESLRPDVLLVAGAPILKPHIFSIPQLATINVHFGISPRYRGEHTLFWPRYFGDHANVGVTIHLIDKGIDTGRILAQGFVGVAAEDDEWEVEAKAARMAAELAVDVLRAGRFEPRFQPTDSLRRPLFRFRGRRLWHDAWYAVRRRWLDEPHAPTMARTVNYCNNPDRLGSGAWYWVLGTGYWIPRHLWPLASGPFLV
jgi:hypothetical protein